MLTALKTFPPALLVLFAFVLLIEIVTFLLLGQLTSIARFAVLLTLMVLTIRGNRPARYALLLLLFAGAVVLIVNGVSANAWGGLAIAYIYGPATILAATALALVLLKRTRNTADDEKAPSTRTDGT